MNQKEINELRRRFRTDKSAISRIYGCYVNAKKEIVSEINTSLGQLPEEEVEMYLGRLKKALSGAQGKNLIDIVFSTQQVMDSDEHRLLSALRESQLKDGDIRGEFYRKAIDALDMGESNYLILLATDSYDVPHRGKDGETDADASDQVFTYVVCAVCPVKDASPELKYFHEQNEFHISSIGQTVGPTALGFLFPAFDDRAANIYNALYYAQKPAELHQEFIDAVFHTEAPMSSEEQREAFETALTDALERECSYEVAQTVHEQLRERIERHKEEKDPEPLSLSVGEIGAILKSGGVSEERVEAFTKECGEQFGENAVLNPGNLIDSKNFEVKTADVQLTVDPERSYLIETRVIDGRPYLLIPAEGVEVNGLAVSVGTESEPAEGKI